MCVCVCAFYTRALEQTAPSWISIDSSGSVSIFVTRFHPPHSGRSGELDTLIHWQRGRRQLHLIESVEQELGCIRASFRCTIVVTREPGCQKQFATLFRQGKQKTSEKRVRCGHIKITWFTHTLEAWNLNTSRAPNWRRFAPQTWNSTRHFSSDSANSHWGYRANYSRRLH